jgi:hypothetical protein
VAFSTPVTDDDERNANHDAYHTSYEKRQIHFIIPLKIQK